jgi:hypothetical protein
VGKQQAKKGKTARGDKIHEIAARWGPRGSKEVKKSTQKLTDS